MIKKNFSLIIIQFLLVIVMVLYLIGRPKELNVLLFWPIVWALVLVSFIIVYRLPKRYKVISLVTLAVALSLIPLLALPEIYYIERDSVFEAQYASIIAEEGKWDPTLGAGFAEDYYGYNPVLHFILSFASLTTGINTFALIKYFFFIFLRLILILSTFMLISTIIGTKNTKVTFLAALIFIGSAGITFVGVSRRTVASILLVLAIYSILKLKHSNNKKVWNFLFMTFSALLVIADHTIAFYFMIFLLGAWIFSKCIPLIPGLKEKKIFPNISYKLIYFITVFFGWEIINYKVLLMNDIRYAIDIINMVLGGAGVKLFLGSSPGFSINIYHFYETFIIYSAQFIFLLLGIIGFFLFIKYLVTRKTLLNKLVDHEYFLLYFAIFGFVAYVFSAILMRTDFDVAVIIILWFFSIPISIFIAYLLESVLKEPTLKKNYFPYVAVVLILLFTGSLLMGIYTPKITNRAPDEDILIGSDPRSKSAELYNSGLWLAKNSKSDSNLVGDIDVHDVYGGFFQFNVNSFHSSLKRLYLGKTDDVLSMISQNNFLFGDYIHSSLKKLYLGKTDDVLSMISRNNLLFGDYKHTRHHDRADYFIINNAFSRYYSEVFGDPITLDNVEGLNEIRLLDKVYNNNEIQIYKIERDNQSELLEDLMKYVYWTRFTTMKFRYIK